MALTIEGLMLRIRHRRFVAILTPVSVGVYLAWVFILQPLTAKFSLARFEKNALTQKASSLNEVIASQNKLASFRGHLVPIEERSKLIEDLNKLANDSGLIISSMMPEEKITMGIYLERVMVRIEAEGDYHQVADFVSRIENMPQFGKVLGLDINLESSENISLAQRKVGLSDNGSIKSGFLKSYKFSIDVGFFSIQKGAL